MEIKQVKQTGPGKVDRLDTMLAKGMRYLSISVLGIFTGALIGMGNDVFDDERLKELNSSYPNSILASLTEHHRIATGSAAYVLSLASLAAAIYLFESRNRVPVETSEVLGSTSRDSNRDEAVASQDEVSTADGKTPGIFMEEECPEKHDLPE